MQKVVATKFNARLATPNQRVQQAIDREFSAFKIIFAVQESPLLTEE